MKSATICKIRFVRVPKMSKANNLTSEVRNHIIIYPMLELSQNNASQ